MTAREFERPRDVRMKGFAHRALVQTALAWIDAHAAPLEATAIELPEAEGRVLAEEIRAPFDLPPFDRAEADGYALHGEETVGASAYLPLPFLLQGESLPARPFTETVAPGSTVRIMAGAPLPAGADAVLPADYASENQGQVEVNAAIAPGENIEYQGKDLRQGACLFKSDRCLRPFDLGLLASAGISRINVIRRSRVRLITFGDELASPGQPRGPYQVFEANRAMLSALIVRDGGALETYHALPDDPAALKQALLAAGADVILVVGGTGVGRHDHAPPLLAQLGDLALHGIALRPADSTGLGRLGAALVFLLPGNPVCCLCAYDFFAGRALRLMGGRSAEWPYRSGRLTVAKKIVSAVGQVDYCRVRRVGDQIEPIASGAARLLSSTARADGFVIVPAASEGFPPGAEVKMYFYDFC